LSLNWCIFGLPLATALGDSLSVRLVNSGPGTVAPGQPFELEIRGDFDANLSAVAFQLTATDGTGAAMIARSADPVETNGLSYLSATSQVPFESELPHHFASGARHEVLYDADFAGQPGSIEDGIPPGSDVMFESITLIATQEGKLTLTISELQAVGHSAANLPQLFGKATIDIASVAITVSETPPSCDGDANDDQTVDPLDAGFVLARLGCPVGGGDELCQAADVNLDGQVDPLDVGYVLSRFGDCMP
jgi:hypothetical protein